MAVTLHESMVRFLNLIRLVTRHAIFFSGSVRRGGASAAHLFNTNGYFHLDVLL